MSRRNNDISLFILNYSNNFMAQNGLSFIAH